MRTQLAELDTFRVGRAHEQAEVARTIGELQAQVAQQSQELAFYRGVVAQGAASIGLKIEQLQHHGDRGQARACSTCTCRWCAPGAPRRDAVGHARAEPRRQRRRVPRRRSIFAALTGGRQREQRYNFRYFQDFDQALSVPRPSSPSSCDRGALDQEGRAAALAVVPVEGRDAPRTP